MKNVNVLRNFLLAIAGAVLLMGSSASAQRFEGKGTATLAPTSGGGTQNVKVVNTSAEPVLIRDVDYPARHPFRQAAMATFSDGQTLVSTSDFTIPAGKRLVIKYVNCNISLPTGQASTLSVEIPEGQFTSIYDLMVNKLLTNGDRDLLIGSQTAEIYADPGLGRVSFLRNSSSGTGEAHVTISGYLVDLP